MLELPETVTIARQMQAELPGKRIESVVCAASPHKFAFFNPKPEAFAGELSGQTMGEVAEHKGYIVAKLGQDKALVFGDFGGRILFHREPSTIPAKHQLLLTFAGGSALTAAIVLWGAIMVVHLPDIDSRIYSGKRMSPLSPDFTYAAFEALLADPEELASKSAKLFMISKPGLAGIGNGCLQDILFRARLHPRRRIVSLKETEKRALYDATRETITLMIDQGGRDCERDLYNQPGGYPVILGSQTAGKPCPVCGTPIAKIAYLGGAAYFCPTCQV